MKDLDKTMSFEAQQAGKYRCVLQLLMLPCQEQFEIYIYSNATREDEKTELFKSIVSGCSRNNHQGKPLSITPL